MQEQPVTRRRSRHRTSFSIARVFNDVDQNIFSERRITQWGFVWGQFLDHTVGLRDGAGPTATAANPVQRR
ncbi:hypothetical protein [Nonomuraea insulae]|uniref:Uncharacterized protein n=1 Tax=Nonomuraea insulae TaxID=1616787 RepID=A0ABW1D9N8_9ACTN